MEVFVVPVHDQSSIALNGTKFVLQVEIQLPNLRTGCVAAWYQLLVVGLIDCPLTFVRQSRS